MMRSKIRRVANPRGSPQSLLPRHQPHLATIRASYEVDCGEVQQMALILGLRAQALATVRTSWRGLHCMRSGGRMSLDLSAVTAYGKVLPTLQWTIHSSPRSTTTTITEAWQAQRRRVCTISAPPARISPWKSIAIRCEALVSFLARARGLGSSPTLELTFTDPLRRRHCHPNRWP